MRKLIPCLTRLSFRFFTSSDLYVVDLPLKWGALPSNKERLVLSARTGFAGQSGFGTAGCMGCELGLAHPRAGKDAQPFHPTCPSNQPKLPFLSSLFRPNHQNGTVRRPGPGRWRASCGLSRQGSKRICPRELPRGRSTQMNCRDMASTLRSGTSRDPCLIHSGAIAVVGFKLEDDDEDDDNNSSKL